MKSFFLALLALLILFSGCKDTWLKSAENTLRDPENSRFAAADVYQAMVKAPKAVVFGPEQEGVLIYENSGHQRNVPFKVLNQKDGVVQAQSNNQKYFLQMRKHPDGSVSAKALGSSIWVWYDPAK